MVGAARKDIVRSHLHWVLSRGHFIMSVGSSANSGEEITSETAYINFVGQVHLSAYEHYTSLDSGTKYRARGQSY